ncbi:unnamed protein product [Notodromas monacha]|uniref:Uncharacterized protein n=1 Tax=Notodromas monacha TaxID=399045 RepID=A0A7R9GER6_9CRUS|nr:unnamed protein product [Notodromas monacha]CAG0918145.1 unnamed protein product [Notodromas monacha]
MSGEVWRRRGPLVAPMRDNTGDMLFRYFLRKKGFVQPHKRLPKKYVPPKALTKSEWHEMVVARALTSRQGSFRIPPPFIRIKTARQEWKIFFQVMKTLGKKDPIIKRLVMPLLVRLGLQLLMQGYPKRVVQNFIYRRVPIPSRTSDPYFCVRMDYSRVSVWYLERLIQRSILYRKFFFIKPATADGLNRFFHQVLPMNIFALMTDIPFIVSRSDEQKLIDFEEHCRIEDMKALGDFKNPVDDPKMCQHRWGKFLGPAKKHWSCDISKFATRFKTAMKSFQDPVMTSVTSADVKLITVSNCSSSLTSATVSKNGLRMGLAYEDATIEIWSLDEKVPLIKIPSRETGCFVDKVSPESKMNFNEAEQHTMQGGHSGPIYKIAFVPSIPNDLTVCDHSRSGYLLSAGEDCSMKLWRVDTCRPVVTYRGHHKPVLAMVTSPTEDYFASGGMDNLVMIWSHMYSNPLRVFCGHKNAVTSLAFHPNEQYMFSASMDREVRMWSVEYGKLQRLFVGSQAGISSVACSGAGNLVISAGDDRKIRVWDIRLSKQVREIKAHNNAIKCVDISADNRLAVSCCVDGTMRLWQLCGKLYQRDMMLKDHQIFGSSIIDVRFANTGLVLAYGVSNEKIGCVGGEI